VALFPSVSYLMDRPRETVTKELLGRVHDAIAIEMAGKTAHWSARGPLREPLHSISDRVAKMGRTHAENWAERAAALGATPSAGVSMSSLPAYPEGLVRCEDHIEALLTMLRAYQENLLRTVNAAAAVNDGVTANDVPTYMKEVDAVGWALLAQMPPAQTGTST